MKCANLVCGVVLLVGFAGTTAFSQDVISAQAGLINHTLGRVLVNGSAVEAGGTRFPLVKKGEVLATEEGRAEVLLDPGTFLRVGERSSFRMLSASLTSWQIELTQGSFVLEMGGEIRRDAPALVSKDFTLSPLKRGVYRIDLEPPSIRVFEGEALVEAGSAKWKLGKGRMLAFDGAWAAARFNRDADDELDRWSARRASYLAQANLHAAAIRQTGPFGMEVSRAGYWVLNPYFGMLTFVPLSGAYNSYYGFSFYSLQRAMEVLYPPQPLPPRFDVGGGYSPAPSYPTNAPTSAGTSGTIAAGSPVSTTPASADTAPISRQSGEASGRTR